MKTGLRLKGVGGKFFDSEKVIRKTTEGERRLLSRGGAFIRQTAKRSMRKRKKVSDPGQPPSSRVGHIKKFLYFAYDARRRSVVVGPARFAKGEAPQLLEEGGSATRQLLKLGQVQGRDNRGRFTKKQLQEVGPDYHGPTEYRHSRRAPRRRVNYRARPYMRPAFLQELPKVREQLKGSIR